MRLKPKHDEKKIDTRDEKTVTKIIGRFVDVVDMGRDRLSQSKSAYLTDSRCRRLKQRRRCQRRRPDVNVDVDATMVGYLHFKQS